MAGHCTVTAVHGRDHGASLSCRARRESTPVSGGRPSPDFPTVTPRTHPRERSPIDNPDMNRRAFGVGEVFPLRRLRASPRTGPDTSPNPRLAKRARLRRIGGSAVRRPCRLEAPAVDRGGPPLAGRRMERAQGPAPNEPIWGRAGDKDTGKGPDRWAFRAVLSASRDGRRCESCHAGQSAQGSGPSER